MVNVRLRVRAHLGREALEFERDAPMPRAPFVGQALPLGRGGEASPLFLAEVAFSAVHQAYVCRAEDDVADGLGTAEALAAAYARAGWRLAARASLLVCPPRRRAAS
jgi:hypothetical protein